MTALLLLARCRYCRNSVRYLYSPWFDWQEFGIRLRFRLKALPQRHRGHRPGCDDSETPCPWRNRLRVTR